MTTRAGVYIRVSTDRQAKEGESLEMQEAKARDLCEANGWEILPIYLDVMTGKSDKRPALKRFEADMRAGMFDAVICYKVDRLGRNRYHLPEMLKFIREREIKLVSLTQQIDMTTAGGRFTLDVLIAAAVYEVENSGERISDTLTHIAKSGRPVTGSAPYGYRYIKKHTELDEQGREVTVPGRLVIDPFESEGIRMAFDVYLERGLHAAAKALNEAGFRSRGGHPWTWRKLTEIIVNPTYGGEMAVSRRPTRNGKAKKMSQALKEMDRWLIVPGQHEAIVSPEITARARARFQEHKGYHPRTRTDLRPWTGLMVCGICVRRLKVQTGGRKGKDLKSALRYNCPHRDTAACMLRAVPVFYLEREVLGAIARAVDASTLVQLGAQEAKKRPAKVTKPEPTRDAQVRAKERELSKLEFRFDHDIISGDTYLAERKRILAEIESLQAEKPKEAKAPTFTLPSRFLEIWEGLSAPEDEAQRRELLHLLLDRIVTDNDQVRVQFRQIEGIEGLPEQIAVERWKGKKDYVLRERWSRTVDACVDCGTTERPYCAKDRCKPCYRRFSYRERERSRG